jgi:hypothetical protein
MKNNYCGGVRAGTGRRLLTVPTQVRFLPPQLCEFGNHTEVIRLDEEPVSKTGAGHTVVGSSPTASAFVNDFLNNMCLWPSGKGAGLPTRTGGFDSRGALLNGSVAQRQSGCLLSTSARVRVPPVPLHIAG